MIYITAASVAAMALFVWLWRRERKGRQVAEYAVVTHQMRLKALEARGQAMAETEAALRQDIATARELHAEEIKPLEDIKDRIDAAVASEGDGELAAEWNRLQGL